MIDEKQFGLGSIPKREDEVDNRDIKYSMLFKINRTIDKVILDTRKILDQGPYGTCVAFALAGVINRFFRRLMSPLKIYKNAKEIDTFKGQDGTTPSFALKGLIIRGTIPEELYPYTEYKGLENGFPPLSNELEELSDEYKIDAYVKITTKEELIDHLMHDNGAIAGMTVGLKSLFNPDILPSGDAVIDVPGLVANDTMAGHAVYLCGADCNMTHTHSVSRITRKGYAKFANSWGTGESRREFGTDDEIIWSETGYGWIPFDYLFGKMFAPDGSMTPYVNEIFVPLKNIPFDIIKIDNLSDNTKPYIKNDRIMLPLRFIGEALGLKVVYVEEDRSITLTGLKKVIQLFVGVKKMLVNGNHVAIDVAPEIKGERTFVPLRVIAEAFGCDVLWFPNERKVEITQGDKIIEMWTNHNEARLISRR